MSAVATVFALLQPLFVPLDLDVGNDAACWIDLNKDGWTDLCAGQAVWFNERGKTFVKGPDVGSVVAADFDNDGYCDLFSWNRQKLYRNVNGKAFEEFSLPTLPTTSSRGACWADFNNDGHVDLYVGGFEDWERQITYPSYILMSKGGRSFEVTWQAAEFRTRGVTACDFDEDGDVDVYTSNYRLQPNQLWLNNGWGGFRDGAENWNAVATSEGFPGGHSIGAAWGDVDNDGRFDLFAGNFAHVDDRGDQPKSRFLCNGGTRFDDKGPCGVFYQESYASPSLADCDNDGDLDLFFTTVYATASFSRPNNAVLFRTENSFQVVDKTPGSGLDNLPPTYQNAWADFDNDGDLDLCTAGKVFRNESAPSHWLKVRLIGTHARTNTCAVGAQVRIKIGPQTYTRQAEAGTGEGNQNDLTLHFGLGSHVRPVQVSVRWPGSERETTVRTRLDRILTLRQPNP